LRVFTLLGSLLILVGTVLGLRYVYFILIGQSGGKIQSLILAAILMIVGFQVVLIGFLADLISFNRKILEEILFRMRRNELYRPNSEDQQAAPTPGEHDP